MVVIRHRGDLKKTRNFLERIVRRNYRDVLKKYGQRGVDALSAATPKDTGKQLEVGNMKLNRPKPAIRLDLTIQT